MLFRSVSQSRYNAIVLKVPIRIYVTFVSTLVSISSVLRGWVLIFSTNTSPIKSIVLDWHLKHEMLLKIPDKA